METLKKTFTHLKSLKKLILLIVPALLIFSCSPEDNNVVQTNETPESYVAIEALQPSVRVVAQDNLYGNGREGITEQNLLITNEHAWIRLLHQMDAVYEVSPTFAEPNVDFNEFQVIAAFDGLQDSGGHTVELELIWSDHNILVNVIKSGPQGNATSVITQPFQIIKIPTTNLPIEFNYLTDKTE